MSFFAVAIGAGGGDTLVGSGAADGSLAAADAESAGAAALATGAAEADADADADEPPVILLQGPNPASPRAQNPRAATYARFIYRPPWLTPAGPFFVGGVGPAGIPGVPAFAIVTTTRLNSLDFPPSSIALAISSARPSPKSFGVR